MKKMILPILAVVIGIGLSAFTSVQKTKTLEALYWFQVEPNAGDESSFDNSEATFLAGPTETVPMGEDCSTGSYKCVIGLHANQVSGQSIINSQTPVSGVGRLRADE